MPMHKLWEYFESFVEKGYTRYIGVSNYNTQSLCNLLSFCKIKPLVNEIEFHPYLTQKHLIEFFQRENILIFGYNPLVKGNYSANSAKQTNIDLLGEKIIVDLATKYKKTVGQIVLNWHVTKGVIPIPMTSNPNRIIENLGSTDFIMEEEDLKKIDTLNKDFRFGRSDMWNIYDEKIDVFA